MRERIALHESIQQGLASPNLPPVFHHFNHLPAGPTIGEDSRFMQVRDELEAHEERVKLFIANNLRRTEHMV